MIISVQDSSSQQLDKEEIVRNFYRAYNAHDLLALNQLLSDSIIQTEKYYTEPNIRSISKDQFLNQVQIGEIFEAKKSIESLEVSRSNGVTIVESTESIKLSSLLPRPMRLKVSYDFDANRINAISIDTLEGFIGYAAELQRRRDRFLDWAEENNHSLNGQKIIGLELNDPEMARELRSHLEQFAAEAPYEWGFVHVHKHDRGFLESFWQKLTDFFHW